MARSFSAPHPSAGFAVGKGAWQGLIGMVRGAVLKDERKAPRFAVLGAGPCGLYGALELARAGHEVLVLEKEDQVGGLAAGQKRGENFYDLGVHMMHAFDEEIFETVSELMGEERIEVELDAKIRWAGSFYRYPLQFVDLINGMNPLRLAWCSMGLLLAQAKAKLFPREAANAQEALQELYGDPLYRFFFEDFTERYWSVHPRDLSATFIKSKMPRLSAVDVLRKFFGWLGVREKTGDVVESALLEETLHYSAQGAAAMPRCLARGVEEAGGRIETSAEVTGVERDEAGRVSAVSWISKSGDTVREEVDAVLSTVPLPALAKSISPAVPGKVLESAKELRFQAIAIHGLLVRKPKILDALYIYYRDQPFHRVGEPKNAGLRVEPEDHTVLIVETTCQEGDPSWKGTETFRREVIAGLEKEGLLREEDIVEWNVLRARHGYPVFLEGFEEHLERVMEEVDSVPGLLTTGRQGGFQYPNMHTAMRMGADAAEELASVFLKKSSKKMS